MVDPSSIHYQRTLSLSPICRQDSPPLKASRNSSLPATCSHQSPETVYRSDEPGGEGESLADILAGCAAPSDP